MKTFLYIGAILGSVCMVAPALALPRPASARALACGQRILAVRGEMSDAAPGARKKAANALFAKAQRELANGRYHACMVSLDDVTFALHHPSSNPNHVSLN